MGTICYKGFSCKLAIALLLMFASACHVFSQETHDAGNAADSARLEPASSINFGLNFKHEQIEDSIAIKFSGVEHFHNYSPDETASIMLTLKPYHCVLKYDSEPIHMLTMNSLMSVSMPKNANAYRPPFSLGNFTAATSGGAGVVFVFSMEDLLQRIFSKAYRYKLHNEKYANSWKYY